MKKWWILLILAAVILILPSRSSTSQDFSIYDYSDSQMDEETLHFDITITKRGKIPPLSRKVDVEFKTDDRTYSYVSSGYPDREEKYIPLDNGVFEFGVILPNDDFTRYVILFDKNHHFRDSDDLKFAVYPDMKREEALILLNKLLVETGYDTDLRPLY